MEEAVKKEVPAGYWQDSQGRLVPEEMITEIDKLRDTLVREIVAKAERLSAVLARFKLDSMGDIQAFVDLSAERFRVKLGGVKGNLQLLSFDGEYKVIRAVSETITFDERLQVAKALIDECIKGWSEGSRDEILALINDAFYVDKLGRINTYRILRLRHLNIADDKWKRAMEAISESLQVAGSKAYIRVYRREKDGGYSQVGLDLAAL